MIFFVISIYWLIGTLPHILICLFGLSCKIWSKALTGFCYGAAVVSTIKINTAIYLCFIVHRNGMLFTLLSLPPTQIRARIRTYQRHLLNLGIYRTYEPFLFLQLLLNLHKYVPLTAKSRRINDLRTRTNVKLIAGSNIPSFVIIVIV